MVTARFLPPSRERPAMTSPRGLPPSMEAAHAGTAYAWRRTPLDRTVCRAEARHTKGTRRMPVSRPPWQGTVETSASRAQPLTTSKVAARNRAATLRRVA
jgi:hypothetical protein